MKLALKQFGEKVIGLAANAIALARTDGVVASSECDGSEGSLQTVGHQADGLYFCAIVHTRWGTIPGKEKNGTGICWYPYGGKEYSVTSGYCVFKEGLHVSTRNDDIIPLGFQTDGVGPPWCALAETRFGRVPGKATASSCGYSYGGNEHVTSRFWFVGPLRSSVRVLYAPEESSPEPIFPATVSAESMLPEYRSQLAKICISPELMRTSEIYDWIAALRTVKSRMDKEELCPRIIAKAFGLRSASEGREFQGRVPVPDDEGVDLHSHFFRDMCQFFRLVTWEATALNAALEILLSVEDPDGLQVIMFRRRSYRRS